ncbi:hypothetical protein HPB49_005712 [Dermacentor silvarum]|uniref:Uncharacterized protein n=1 Tax=Dermacentor silvarum TaxID=543639 RepID=A0ACB8C7I6_DERSI|nr:hypothetical protein HPB49_005712 [Dermacentor silvarum]
MVVSCCAVGCTKRAAKGSGVGFFRFPKENTRRKAWVQAVRREKWQPSDSSRICGLHFITASNHGSAAHTGCVGAAYAAYASRDKANPEAESDGDAVASTLFLGDIEPEPTESDGDAVASTLFLGDIEPDPTDGEDEMEPDSTDDEASNDLPESMQLLQAQLPAPSHHMGGFSRNLQARMQEKYLEKCRAYNALQERYLIMENELRDLRAKRSSEANGAAAAWGYAAIAGHSEKVAYYTGLPNKETFAWVVSVYRTACPSVETMSHEDQVLLVLMRLRLDIHLCFLADLFKINKKYVSTIFESALTTLVSELKGLVVWPDDVAFHAWQPKISQCQRFRHVRVIIDSTEIRLERSSASTAQSRTWSQYKNSNTIKVLVGITPNGLISYISECWGGKTSDKQLVLQTDFTKYLDYGDEVMADRGFNVTEELAVLGVKVMIPAYTKGKNQPSQAEVTASREISCRRIRVEQVIGRMKRFHILKNTVPYFMKDYLDDVVLLIAALTNLMPRFG